MKRRLLIVVMALVAVVLIAGFAARRYLQSQRGAEHVATRLESLVGGKVQIGQADVGLNSTTLRNLELAEETNGGSKKEPWLKVSSLVADLSLWDLLSGNAEPKRVTLQGVSLLLRFDADGNLLTRFPSPSGSADSAVTDWPEVMLESAEVVFRKEGHSDLTVTNVKARLSNDAGKPALTGSGDNAELGKLNLSGSLDKVQSLAVVQLKTDKKALVSQALLALLPFVPSAVWSEIHIESGETPAELTIRFDLKKYHVSYRLELQPENTKLHVPAIDLSAHNASGSVLVEDNRVELRNIRGEAFGGLIRTDADLDFRNPISKLLFKRVEVERLEIDRLPEDWNIPNVVRKSISHGQLHGEAAIEVTITPGLLPSAQLSALAAISGSSSGFAPAFLLTDWPSADVQFRTKGKGQVRDPAGKQAPVEFDWRFKPRRIPIAKALPLETRVAPVADVPGSPSMDDTKIAVLREVLTGLVVKTSFVSMQQKKEQQKDDPKYFDLNLGLKNVDLAALVENLELKLPIGVAGKLSFDVKASVPTDTPANLRAYKAEGKASLRELVIGDTQVEEVNATFVYDDGVLTMTSLDGKLGKDAAGGTFNGSGAIQVVPQGELRANLMVERIAVNQLIGLGAEQIDGTFSGKLRIHAPVEKLATLSALNADGVITSDRLKVYGLNLDKIASTIELKDAVLKLPDIRLELEGTPVKASAKLQLTDVYAFDARLDLRAWNLASLQLVAAVAKTVLPTFKGDFSTTMDLRGQLKPFQITASGDTETQSLRVDAFEAEAVKFRWETDGKSLQLKEVNATLYGGKAIGTAIVPFDANAAGSLDLVVSDVNVHKLVKDLRVPFAIEGKINGKLKGTFSSAEKGKERIATLHLDLDAPKMRVQNIPAEKLTGTFDYQKGALDYKLQGKTLGGTFDLEGQIPRAANPPEPKLDGPKKGRLRISGVQISRLFQALGAVNADGASGGLSIDVTYTHDPGDPYPEGRGVMRVSNLRWKDTLLSDNLQGDILISEQQIRLRNLTANIADGTFGIQLAYYMRQPERSWFNATFNRVDAAHLLGPWFGEQIEGPLQARIRGTLGSEWRGTADVVLDRGKAFGFQVSQWRVPITWTYAPAQRRGKLEILESGLQFARGRATAKLSLTWSDTVRVEGQLRLANAELKEVLAQAIGPSELGSGQMTARLDFAGDNVRSLDDLSGNLIASFQQTQALQLPVLKQIAPVVGVGQSTTFQKGELRARLSKGVLRIQQLALEGNTTKLHIDGTVTLDGRLNLDVVAGANFLGLPGDRLRLLGLRIPAAGSVPLTVLQEASNLFAGRVIYLSVTGTVRNPNIRVHALRILSEEALRYFLRLSGVPVVPSF